MKNKLLLILCSLFLSFFIFSCDEENPVEIEPPAPDIIIADNISQVDSNTFKVGLVTIDSDQIIYSSNNSFTQSLVVGGFITSDYGEGILRKIETIQIQGNQVIINTRKAGLDEVLLKGTIDFRGKLNPESLILEKSSHDGIKLNKENGEISIGFNGVSFGAGFDLDINTGTSFDPPEFIFHAEFNFGLKSFEAGVVVSNDSYVEVNTNASVSVSGQYSPHWAQISFYPGIPTGIPFVTIVPKIKIVLNGEVGIEQVSVNRVDATTTITGGITYENGVYDSYSTLDQQFNFSSDLTTDAYARIGLSIPRVGLYLAGAAGAFVELQVYGKFEVGEDNHGVYRGVYAGLEGNAGVEAKIFGFNLQYTKDLFSEEWILEKEYLANAPPTAFFTVDPSNGNTTTIFNFDASGSSDNEDPLSALQVRWDWENDGIWDTPYSTTKIESHLYSSQGQYSAKLQVKDTEGLTDEHIKTITVTHSTNVIVPLSVGNYWQYLDTNYTNNQTGTSQLNISATRTISYQGNNVQVFDWQWQGDNTKYFVDNNNTGCWIYGNSESGVLVNAEYIAKYPTYIGESWISSTFYTGYSVNVTCIATNENFLTPLGTISCYVYHFQINSDRPIEPGNPNNSKIYGNVNNSSNPLELYDYYVYFNPNLGYVGFIAKQGSAVVLKKVIYDYYIN